MSFSALLKRLVGGEVLDAEDSARAFGEIMAGSVSEAEMASFLTALAIRGPSEDEIVGAARAMRAAMTSITAPPDAIDLCGTGGDGHGTLSISTATAFVVAACGVPVAKHGNRSISSRTGTADVLEVLGVRTDLPPAAAQACLHETNFCFLFAPAYHPAMKHVAGVRRALGFRTIFNLLGPLASPANVTRQLLGVFARDYVTPIANVLASLGTTAAWVVHGSDGMDEITTTGTTNVAVLHGGHIAERSVTPDDAGLPRSKIDQLKGGDAQFNAKALTALFKGDGQSAYHDIVALNAGAALVVAGKASELKRGTELASAAIKDGRAMAALNSVVAFSRKAAA